MDSRAVPRMVKLVLASAGVLLAAYAAHALFNLGGDSSDDLFLKWINDIIVVTKRERIGEFRRLASAEGFAKIRRILTGGVLRDNGRNTFAVIGGTGAYEGARGTQTEKDLGSGGIETIHLLP